MLLELNKFMNKEINLTGIGLHSGEKVNITIKPAKPGEGRYFVRKDLPNTPVIPAKVHSVSQTVLSTELATEDAKVRTVEHLLAALATSGVENARIEIDGPEVPLLDGSAKIWMDCLAASGMSHNNCVFLNPKVAIESPIWLRDEDSFVAAIPSTSTRFSYGIDFEYSAIGNQWYSWNPATESFAEALAPARTFALAEQIEHLQASGLIKGGSLENALVCDRNGLLNPPLRFPNEPVRHKLLDLVGDLSLLGTYPQAHYLAYKASHKLHIQLANAIKNLKILENYVNN